MNKLLCFAVASTLALGASTAFAAGTMKLEELTKEQRTEMRNRADSLVAERAAKASSARHTPDVKKPYRTKATTDSRS